MCLRVDEKVTAKVQRRLDKHRQIRYWRCFAVMASGRSLSSTYRYCRMRPGRNRSSRKSTRRPLPSDGFRTINRGRHVFLTKRAAERCRWSSEVVLPVVCKHEHFVAAGDFEGDPSAVFTEIYVNPEDYAKALGRDAKNEKH